jgi:hypothetical protein
VEWQRLFHICGRAFPGYAPQHARNAVRASSEKAKGRINGAYLASRTCAWRIGISPKIPQDSPSCYDSLMRNLAVLFIHFIAVLARLIGPGGVRSLIAESLLLKHQILILNRSRKRSPNLHVSDRILAGLMALLVRPTRLLRSAIVLKPSTLLALHKFMSEGKARCFHRQRIPFRRMSLSNTGCLRPFVPG